MQRTVRTTFILLALLTARLTIQAQGPPPVAGSSTANPAPPAAKAPVLILLKARFADHTQPHIALERIQRLLPLLRDLRRQYPGTRIASTFEFSGSLSEVISSMNEYAPVIQGLKDAQREGLIQIGYTGEDEPTYANRPQPNFLRTNTVEERWLERTGAAERFLTEYKDAITGNAVPGLSGSLKRTQEVLGEASLISGAMILQFSDNSPVVHQIRRFNTQGVLMGLPDPDSTRAIPEYRAAMQLFGRTMSPLADGTSPEVYFEDNVLRVSDSGGPDLHSLTTADRLDNLKSVFTKLDRSRPRVVQLEIGTYSAYLKKGADGQLMYPPLQWAYSRPNSPAVPTNLSNFVIRQDFEANWAKEEAALRWVAREFLHDNPGSRFVTPGELRDATANNVGREVDAASIKAAAEDLLRRYANTPVVADFAYSGRLYFSLADMFQLLAGALADLDRTGTIPLAVKLSNVYGPLDLTPVTGPAGGQVAVPDVVKAAASLAGVLSDSSWKPVPSNAVPAFVDVAGLRLNAAQFLKLMAQVYLNPEPSAKLTVSSYNMMSRLAASYPRHAALRDLGNLWTMKPAILAFGGPGFPPPPPPPPPPPAFTKPSQE